MGGKNRKRRKCRVRQGKGRGAGGTVHGSTKKKQKGKRGGGKNKQSRDHGGKQVDGDMVDDTNSSALDYMGYFLLVLFSSGP
jgi:hypothetical protein